MSVGSVSGTFWGPGEAGRVEVERARAAAQSFLFAAVCEGNSTCSENEVCVRPGECRCRHGYFGANCDTSERGGEVGVGCWTAWRETREITRRQIGAGLALGGWLWQSRGWGVCRLTTKLSPRAPGSCRVPAPVLGPRLQGEVQLSPSRTVRGRDRAVYVSRAPLGCALRACVPVPAWHVPPAERRVPLRAGLVGCAMR